jgi:hypothetical protein
MKKTTTAFKKDEIFILFDLIMEKTRIYKIF